MKCLLKICLIVMANAAYSVPVLGAPVNEAEATITSYDYRLTQNGYIFEYSTSNGLFRKEEGEIINGENDDTILRIIGSYSYKDGKGELHEVHYGADEKGSSFRKSAVVETPVLSSPPAYEPKGISTAALASLSG